MASHFKKGDLLAIAAVALLAVLVLLAFLPGGEEQSGQVEIYQHGALIKVLDLSTDTTYGVDGKYANEITISGGEVAITKSDCPGEDCVHSGWIHASGRSLVCLPNGLEVRIVAKADDVDFVVG